MRSALTTAILVALFAGCASSSSNGGGDGPAASKKESTVLTVEGRVTVRGNEPLTKLVLETADSNKYVLAVEGDMRKEIQSAYPSLCRITGTLYSAEWAGQAYAHLDVTAWEPID